jgi:threonine dehydratase
VLASPPSVVVVLCGGNIDTTVLGRCLERGLAADGRLARFTVRLKDRAGSVATLTKFLYEQNARLDPEFHKIWPNSELD